MQLTHTITSNESYAIIIRANLAYMYCTYLVSLQYIVHFFLICMSRFCFLIFIHPALWVYVSCTWHLESIWWSNFMQSQKTNNDVEVWHHRLNQQLGWRPNLPFHQLIVVLHKEANTGFADAACVWAEVDQASEDNDEATPGTLVQILGQTQCKD